MNSFIVLAPILLIIPIIVAVFFITKSNPMEIEKAKILKKTPGGAGKLWYIHVEINGEEKTLRTKYYVFINVSEGEEVTLWYRGDYCFRFSK